MSRPPVLADVARKAGTSVATVSRVLSRRESVSPETAERVRQAIDATGFVLNQKRSAAVRNRFRPRTLKYGVFGFLVSRDVWTDESVVRSQASIHVRNMVLDSFLGAADEAGVKVHICRVVTENIEQGTLPPSLRDARLDGILSQASAGRDYAAIDGVAPLVFFGNHPTASCPIPSVEPDVSSALDSIVQHLFDLGHRRFAFLACEKVWGRIHQSHLRRREAFTFSAENRGCTREIWPYVNADGVDSMVSAYAARPTSERPTAVVCSHDGAAHALLSGLAARGFRVPQDLSITGFDGLSSGMAGQPRLTTWLPNWELIGRKSFEVLMARARGAAAPLRTLVGGQLCVGESSGRIGEGVPQRAEDTSVS